MNALGTRPPLVVFSDDWGRHPSSAQHLIAHLLASREVLWVNTIGTRSIRFDLKTAHRVIEKLGHWISPRLRLGGPPQAHMKGSEPADTLGPKVLSPIMWPSFSSRPARTLNRALLERSLTRAIAELSGRPDVITTLPIVADLVGRLPVRRWVYYCVDDFGSWPGYDGDTMRSMEQQLITKVDACLAVSPVLMTHLGQLGARPTLLTHGVDLKFWNRLDQPGERPIELSTHPGPLVMFWGLIDRRMDVDWIEQLSLTLTHRRLPGEIVLIGPQEDPDPRLWTIPRVSVLPAVAMNRLPEMAACASVLVMPYKEIPATVAMQPLKLKEYLATGKPVVVRRLPSTLEWADVCDVCASPQAFVEAVVQRLAVEPLQDQIRARERLRSEDWAGKAEILNAVLANGGWAGW